MKGLFPEQDMKRALDYKTFGPTKPSSAVSSPETCGPVIGMSLCWCGREKGHDWLGKEDGDPHPRYPE